MHVHCVMTDSIMCETFSVIKRRFVFHCRKFSNNELLRSWRLPSTKSDRRLFLIHQGERAARVSAQHLHFTSIFNIFIVSLNIISMCALSVVYCGWVIRVRSTFTQSSQQWTEPEEQDCYCVPSVFPNIKVFPTTWSFQVICKYKMWSVGELCFQVNVNVRFFL